MSVSVSAPMLSFLSTLTVNVSPASAKSHDSHAARDAGRGRLPHYILLFCHVRKPIAAKLEKNNQREHFFYLLPVTLD